MLVMILQTVTPSVQLLNVPKMSEKGIQSLNFRLLILNFPHIPEKHCNDKKRIRHGEILEE